MNRKPICWFWKDTSKEDENTTKFLELLLKYNYEWHEDNQATKLNLKKKKKRLFLKDCSESIEDLGELRAAKNIKIIRNLFIQEYSRYQDITNKTNELKLPWFFLAYQLFECSPASKDDRTLSSATAVPSNSLALRIMNASISCPSTSTIDLASDFGSSNILTLPIMNASNSITLHLPKQIPIVQTFPWTSLLPNWKLPSHSQDSRQPTKPSAISQSEENVYDWGISQKNMKSQYKCPVKYPVCILPCASIGRFGEDSKISCPGTDSEIAIPIYQSSISRPHTSDSSKLSAKHGNLTQIYEFCDIFWKSTGGCRFKNINQSKSDF